MPRGSSNTSGMIKMMFLQKTDGHISPLITPQFLSACNNQLWLYGCKFYKSNKCQLRLFCMLISRILLLLLEQDQRDYLEEMIEFQSVSISETKDCCIILEKKVLSARFGTIPNQNSHFFYFFFYFDSTENRQSGQKTIMNNVWVL